ncbi:MAG: YraN family protein [Verrucomicrobiae bacterium]|nr:YraN family protein [Verrucomicrobiae bacterium]
MRPSHRRPCPESGDTGARGSFGERAAAAFLRTRGYRILTRRFAAGGGEIDLVCRHGEVLAFVEVKARSRDDFGRPAEAVTAKKRRRIAKAALAYLQLLGNPAVYFRFDIVEVFLQPGAMPRFGLIPNAFDLPEPYLY